MFSSRFCAYVSAVSKQHRNPEENSYGEKKFWQSYTNFVEKITTFFFSIKYQFCGEIKQQLYVKSEC
jgi:hypothetical protein